MKLRQIEVFYAVYLTGSVTSAAKMLFVSQPSVSKVLSHTESQLGYKLFQRVKGQLVPTAEAHELFEVAGPIYEDIGRLRELSSGLLNSSTGLIRVAAIPALGLEVVPTAVARCIEAHPKLEFDVQTLHFHQISRALSNRQLDVGVVFESASLPGISEEPLAEGEFVVVAPRGWISADTQRVALRSIMDRPLVKLNSRSPLGGILAAQLNPTEKTWPVAATVDTYYVAKSLAHQGVGVAIVDEVTALSHGLGALEMFRLDPALRFTVKALRLEAQATSAGAESLVAALRQSLVDLLGSGANSLCA